MKTAIFLLLIIMLNVAQFNSFSGVLELEAKCVHLFLPRLGLMTSHWSPEISHGRSIYAMERGKSGLPLLSRREDISGC